MHPASEDNARRYKTDIETAMLPRRKKSINYVVHCAYQCLNAFPYEWIIGILLSA